MITIIGGGLAGCEAAWQAAALDVPVVIHEMRPVRPTAVHKTDGLAELVCSNSFRGDKLDNAVGLLKEEMRRLGSLIMRAADLSRVPAGAALAVDRVRFSETVTREIANHPRIRVVREEVTSIPSSVDAAGPVIVATGPLTSDSLSRDVAALVGGDHLYFYDAISPIVLAESHRHVESLPRLPLGAELSGTLNRDCPRGHSTGTVTVECPRAQLWSGRRGGGLPELSDGQGAVRRNFTTR